MTDEQEIADVAPSEVDIALRNLTKRFGDVAAVDDLSLDIPRGSFFALLGPSGCGKTTTLRMIGGFEEPTAGTVELAGTDVTNVPPHKRDVNTVFQSYALFPHMTVEKNVAFGLERRSVPKADVKRRVAEALDLVELGPLARRAHADVGRPAAARRTRARTRQPAEGAAARRAARRAGPAPAQAAPDRAQPHPARGRDHLRPCHA